MVVGLLGMGMAFLLQHLGSIFEISVSIRSVAEGPLLGLFVLGMMCPWVGKRGALAGCLLALGVMHWLVIGNQWHVYNQRIRHTALPTSIENCPYPLNETVLSTGLGTDAEELDDEPFFLFRISMLHFSFIGSLVTVVAGIAVSLALGETDLANVDPDHITPIMQR